MKVLIVQSEIETAQTLTEIFIQRGDQVYTSLEIEEAIPILQQEELDLMVLDLHLPKDAHFELLRGLREKYPQVKIIISNQYPDLSREIEIKEYGVNVFLRAPFNKSRVKQAVDNLMHSEDSADQADRSIQTVLPRVRFPVRLKIILPYLILALLLAMGAGYVVGRVALDSIEERFINSLVEVGQLASGWMVEEETNRLQTLRLVSHTDGLAEAVENEDAETLREILLGIAINNQEDAIEIINPIGTSIISVRHQPGGGREDYEYSKDDTIFTKYEFVNQVLEQREDDRGDKFSGLIQAPYGDYFYIIGPIINGQNQFVGAVLVGRYIPNLVMETRENILGRENVFAHISFFNLDGKLLSSTLLEPVDIDLSADTATELLSRQDQESHIRQLHVSEIDYREIIAPWEVRGGQDLGLIGVSMAETFLVRPSEITQIQIFLIASFGFLLIITTGMALARRITNPLKSVVTAASQVSEGKWNVNVEPQGSDELAYLAHAFNYMVSHLREGEIYRDLLGRTITPQVRDQLRSGLTTGTLKLEGQNTIATIMITDIRQFTAIAESQPPTKVLNWLNQYYGEIVPIVGEYNGVMNEFAGDSVMAFFGVLPISLEPSESAYQACLAAIDILETVKKMNADRLERDAPPFVTGIGINTGEVAAGGMGTADRLHYSIIGDAVNVTQRLESLTKDIGETSAIISQDTYEALDYLRDRFQFVPMGSHVLKGKSEPIQVYRLLPQSQKSHPKLVNLKSSSME